MDKAEKLEVIDKVEKFYLGINMFIGRFSFHVSSDYAWYFERMNQRDTDPDGLQPATCFEKLAYHINDMKAIPEDKKDGYTRYLINAVEELYNIILCAREQGYEDDIDIVIGYIEWVSREIYNLFSSIVFDYERCCSSIL